MVPKNRDTQAAFSAQAGQSYQITLNAQFVRTTDNAVVNLSLTDFSLSDNPEATTPAAGFSLNSLDLSQFNYGGDSVSANIVFPADAGYCIVSGDAVITTYDGQYTDGIETTSVGAAAEANPLSVMSRNGGDTTVVLDFFESREAQEAGAEPLYSVTAVVPFF